MSCCLVLLTLETPANFIVARTRLAWFVVGCGLWVVCCRLKVAGLLLGGGKATSSQDAEEYALLEHPPMHLICRTKSPRIGRSSHVLLGRQVTLEQVNVIFFGQLPPCRYIIGGLKTQLLVAPYLKY